MRVPVPNARARTLLQNVRRLKLNAAQLVPIHERVGWHDECEYMAGRTE
ncbi:MAG: hypothetical protein ABL993_08980 [Vicinamibacterales bacterium]